MIKNLIWDLDGTLFDTYPSIVAAFHSALHDLGAEVDRDVIMPLARVSFKFCGEQLSQQTGLESAAILERFLQHYANVPPELSPPFPGVRELCMWAVARGGKNVIVTHRMRVSTEALLDMHGLREFFTGWITHDDGFPRKPAPDSFLEAIARFDLKPVESLAIGDRDLDLLAAQAAGVGNTCAFGPGPFSVCADLRAVDFSKLLELLR